MAEDVLDIDSLLEELGYASVRVEARLALQRAGLTNPRKRNITALKRSAAEAVLAGAFVRICSDPRCSAAVRADARMPAPVERARCEICRGSPNAAAVAAMAEALAAA